MDQKHGIYNLSPNHMAMIEQMIIGGAFANDKNKMLDYILDEGVLVQGCHKAAALLCLYSGTCYGLSKEQLDHVELQFSRYYGFNSSFLFRALYEMKVLKIRQGSIPIFGSTDWDNNASAFRVLWPSGIDSRQEYLEWRKSDNDSTLDDDPASCPLGRLVQWALQEVNGQPGWELPELAARIAQLRGGVSIKKAREDSGCCLLHLNRRIANAEEPCQSRKA